MLRTGWVVDRRTVRVSSPRSMVMVWAATWTVTIRRAWIRIAYFAEAASLAT
jgi:hypothetical protein